MSANDINVDLGCRDTEAVYDTDSVSSSHTFDISGSYRRFEPLLGGENQDSLYYSTSKSCIDRVKKITTITRDYILHQNLEQIYFVTIRPSPEYVFMLNHKIPPYEHQIQYIMGLIQQPSVEIISGSVEKGTKKTQVLHYHLVIKASKRKMKKWLKHVTDHVTCLHKIYGKQKAVKVSETQAGNIQQGIDYFNGISKNVNNSLKPDVYKHIIGKILIKTFKKLFSKY